MSTTSERAFESQLEQMLAEGGWQPGTHAEWDKARALFPPRVFAFVEATQPKLWSDMAALQPVNRALRQRTKRARPREGLPGNHIKHRKLQTSPSRSQICSVAFAWFIV